MGFAPILIIGGACPGWPPESTPMSARASGQSSPSTPHLPIDSVR